MYLRALASISILSCFTAAFGQESTSHFNWDQVPRNEANRLTFEWQSVSNDSAPSLPHKPPVDRSGANGEKQLLPASDNYQSYVDSTAQLKELGFAERSNPNKFARVQDADSSQIGSYRPVIAVTRQSQNAFTADKYTAPLKAGEELFSGLKTDDTFRNAGGISLQQVAVDNSALPFTWASPAFYHRPLYFEQPNLERYGIGHRKCFQPIFSGIHFYGNVFLLPVKLMTQPPGERSSTLGHQRPGNTVRYQRSSLGL